MTATSSPTYLPPVRIINLHHVPLRGYDLAGVWTVFERDLSRFKLRETTHEPTDLDIPFPAEAIYTHEEDRARWLVVKDQEERLVLLHGSMPAIPYAKGDPIYWGVVPGMAGVPGEIENGQDPLDRAADPFVSFLLRGSNSTSYCPASQIRLRNRYSRRSGG